MKIGVLFNCQHASLAASLRQLLPDCEVVDFRFAALAGAGAAAEDAAVILRRCDAVITTATGAKLGRADPAALAADGVRIVRIPHLVFGGFHPDTCYSPDPARGIPGPTERFHSRIAACAFLGGLTIDDTVALYSKLAFARLGYFEQFGEQRAAVIGQWDACGIDLAPSFDRWTAQGCFMHSMNHPKIAPVFDIARIVCGMLGVTPAKAAKVPDDPMLTYASHPVYAELAEAFGIMAETAFRPPTAAGSTPRTMELPAFLTRSFAAFAAAPAEVIYGLGGVPEALRALELKRVVA